MSKIFCSLSGVTFQTELTIMTFVDAMSSLRDWTPPFDWANKIDQIWKTTISRTGFTNNYDEYIKIALSWVVVSRMVVAHLYTITYAANFYAILTWCHGKILLPWLMLSAFKNFILESIVILVVILLYLEGNLSAFLFTSIMLDKLISSAIAAHNWYKINSLYVKLENKNSKKTLITNMSSITTIPSNIMLGMSMQSSGLNNKIDNQIIDTSDKYTSLPNLGYVDIDLSLMTITSLSSNNESEEQSDESQVNIIDDYELTTAEKVRRILGLPLDDENIIDNKLISTEIDEKTLNVLINNESTPLNEDDDNDNQSNSCYCPTQNDKSDDGTKVDNIENLLNNNYQNEDNRNEIIVDNNDTEWVNQWSMKELLKSKRLKLNKRQDRLLFQLNYTNYSSKLSSDDELNHSMNSFSTVDVAEIENERVKVFDSNNIEFVDKYTLYPSEIENRILNHEINSLKTNIFDNIIQPTSETINLTNSTNSKIDNDDITISYDSSSTQTSICKIIFDNSYYQSLLSNNSTSKKYRLYETARERQEKELIALKSYNAKTLWKDKQKSDKNKLKFIYGRESNLFKNNQSIKSNDDKQLFKHKQRHEMRNISGLGRNESTNLKIKSVSCKKIQVSLMGRNLHRIKARENIPRHYLMKTALDLTNIDKVTAKYRKKKLLPTVNSQLISNNTSKYFNIKNKIDQLDWSISSWELDVVNDNSLSKLSLDTEFTMFDVIDENNTVELLQSAFSFDSRNTDRGFYLGPASTDYYSLSEQIPNVFQEIIKATRLPTVHNDCNNLSTSDIDFGEIYYQELITCGGDYELFETVEYSNSINPENDVEIYTIDYWIKKLQELSLNNDENSRGPENFEKLNKIPELFIFKRLINNLCNLQMISTSTNTSTVSIPIRKFKFTSTTTLNYSTK
ncbi:hypothetical protein PV325_000593 [Microctonus aethiopoides]|nr:hypothetical protein PV325_000593 [Microctonus aethiopoides]